MWKHLQTDKNGTPARFEDGQQIVMSSGCPPLQEQKCVVFSQKLTTNGLPGGTSEMGVDGSVTAVDYYLEADEDNDLYITKLSFVCGYGGSAEMFEFADSGAALTNGIRVFYTDAYLDERTIINPKANYEFQRASLASFSRTNWEERGFAATGDYGWLATVPIDSIMPPYGIKLDRGTMQRLTIRIRDNCTDANLFNCDAFGFERIP